MTDLTHRQLLDAITRSLKETGKRMAATYRGVAADQPAHRAGGRKRARAAGLRSAARRERG